MGDVKGSSCNPVRTLIYHYPLSLTGSLLFLLNVVVFFRAFAMKDPYSWLLSCIILFLLVCLVIAGKYQAWRATRAGTEWLSSSSMHSPVHSSVQDIYLRDVAVWPFFRVHCSFSGRMQAGRDASFSVFQESSSGAEDRIHAVIQVPFSGVLDSRLRLMIKDVFGLTRNRFGAVLERKLFIRPVLFHEHEQLPVHAMDGMNEKSKKKESEVERYLMREYLPGDRLRDINWKASSRFSGLFTRIPPPVQEETRIISVFMRPYSRLHRDTIVSVAHLDHLKSRLLSFITDVRRQYPDHQFQVHAGMDTLTVKTDEDIETLGVQLCSLYFLSPPSLVDDPLAMASGPVFVFTTPYDSTLQAALDCQTRPETRIFTTAFPGGRPGQEAMNIGVFRVAATLNLPGAWLFRKDPGQLKGDRKGIRNAIRMGIRKDSPACLVSEDVLNLQWYDPAGRDGNDD
jgi:uncharacterized protein (DUF58 family)